MTDQARLQAVLTGPGPAGRPRPGQRLAAARGAGRVHLLADHAAALGRDITLLEEPGDYLAVVLSVDAVDELDALLAR